MSDERPVIIAQISDMHCGSQYHIPSLATRVVDEINELAPDALVVTGDLTDMGFRQEFKVAHRLISRMQVEHVMVLPGQPRRAQRGRPPLRGAVRRALHRAGVRGVHILGLDSSEPDLDSGRIGRQRYQWIEERFSDPAEFKIVALHHHLLPVPGTGRERNIVYDAGDLLRVLNSSGCDMVMCGHKHVPNVWRLEEMVIVNAGTACSHRSAGHDTRQLQHHRGLSGPRPRGPQASVPRPGGGRRLRARPAPGVHLASARRWSPRRVRLMARAIALIDGEHYPPVVRFALARAGVERDEVLAAVFIGGTEKVDAAASEEVYGVPVVVGARPAGGACRGDRRATRPRWSSTSRTSRCSRRRTGWRSRASRSVSAWRTAAPTSPSSRRHRDFGRPRRALAIIGTGKRVGKTAVSAHVARYLKAAGRDIVVLAMGRGGPAEPELIRGDEVALTTDDLLALARQGVHASSDNYEDAVMSRVTTVGCRRCGGGLAGETFFTNVAEGALLADSLGKELIVLEGSGAAIPPVRPTPRCSWSARGRACRTCATTSGRSGSGLADAVVVAGAEEPIAEPGRARGARGGHPPRARGRARGARDLPAAPARRRVRRAGVLRDDRAGVARAGAHGAPRIESTAARSWAPARTCRTVSACVRTCVTWAGRYDLLLTELKAAAIDVVAAAGAEAGVPTVLCDNVPVSTDGGDLAAADRPCRGPLGHRDTKPGAADARKSPRHHQGPEARSADEQGPARADLHRHRA